jgi:hypothetical protein
MRDTLPHRVESKRVSASGHPTDSQIENVKVDVSVDGHVKETANYAGTWESTPHPHLLWMQ